jgi:hypothetical protein
MSNGLRNKSAFAPHLASLGVWTFSPVVHILKVLCIWEVEQLPIVRKFEETGVAGLLKERKQFP